MDKLNKHDVVVQAIEVMKHSQFGLTAIKVELEAQLNRRSHGSGGCDDYDDGFVTCAECDGCWEGEMCDTCDGDGNITCDRCDGEGEVADEDEMVMCDDCEGDGHYTCEDCYEGSGYYESCEYCDEGRVQCEWCDGAGNTEQNWGSEAFCQNYILEKLSAYDLAEFNQEDGRWEPKHPLVFARFYNDHSVDSELTFTLAMDDPENVFLLPHFISAFNEFAEAVGGSFDTTGAGMHMALLNSPNCNYPTRMREGDENRFQNFRRSMSLLLPALYFLGSSDDRSRALRYRRPMVECGDYSGDGKYCAVSYRGGAVEFRVFDTCYDKPEAILDNIVVMKNCMRFWRNNYHNPGLNKITPRVEFGLDGSDKLDRFYITSEHIDLLNRGLRLLKPSYYTVQELKKQRNFCTTKTHVKNRLKKAKTEAEIEYKEYENRFSWNIVMRRNRYMAQQIERRVEGTMPGELGIPEALMAEIEQQVEREVQEFTSTKKSLERYVEEKLRDLQGRRVGEYTLIAE